MLSECKMLCDKCSLNGSNDSVVEFTVPLTLLNTLYDVPGVSHRQNKTKILAVN